MKTLLFILFITLTAFVISCSKSGVELKEGTLNLALKKCAEGKINGDKLSFCFDSLVSDSRCPANAMCVWQGTAVAKFSLTKNNETSSFELATINMSPNYHKDTTMMGYKIDFINLSPYPGTVPTPVPADQIKAELKITKQ
ncbi:MAG TPA: hypothetical protein VFU29_13365 [Chitinophagaceae bacterium]|nr:hypothetical protein [Chitinophagaceae bacterium]